MRKLFTLLFSLMVSVSSISAENFEHVLIGDLYYNLDTESQMAEVTYQEQNSENNYLGLTAAIIPDTVEYNTNALGVTCIGNDAFAYCSSLKSIEIPDSVKTIKWSAFRNCSSLASIELPDHLACILDYAFIGCSGLTSIELPESVTTVGFGICYDCSGLTSPVYNEHIFVTLPTSYSGLYIIPEGIEQIAGAAFVNCNNLTSVKVSGNVSSIGFRAFDCPSLESLVVDNSNTMYDSRDSCNAIIETATNILVAGCKNSVIPNDIVSIGKGAFTDCIGLTSIEIPDKVVSIGSNAFVNCTGLTSLTFPASVTSIESYAFLGCSSITTLNLPNSIKNIGEGAFSYGTGLTSITCEASIPPVCEEQVFNLVNKSIPVFVSAESIEAYKVAYGWREFTNIQPIQATEVEVTEIEAEPTDNSVVIEWPKVDEATVYTIEIRQDGELICTLMFNEQGQLQSITYAKPPHSDGRESQVRTATQTTTGWQYTINGLKENTEYTFQVVAKKSAGDTETLYNETISFTTESSQTGMVESSIVQPLDVRKMLRNGELYILCNGKTYVVTGAMVK